MLPNHYQHILLPATAPAANAGAAAARDKVEQVFTEHCQRLVAEVPPGSAEAAAKAAIAAEAAKAAETTAAEAAVATEAPAEAAAVKLPPRRSRRGPTRAESACRPGSARRPRRRQTLY